MIYLYFIRIFQYFNFDFSHYSLIVNTLITNMMNKN